MSNIGQLTHTGQANLAAFLSAAPQAVDSIKSFRDLIAPEPRAVCTRKLFTSMMPPMGLLFEIFPYSHAWVESLISADCPAVINGVMDFRRWKMKPSGCDIKLTGQALVSEFHSRY